MRRIRRIAGNASPVRNALRFVRKNGGGVQRDIAQRDVAQRDVVQRDVAQRTIAGLLLMVFAATAGPAAGQEASHADAARAVRLHVLADSVAIGEQFFMAVVAQHDTSETAAFRLPDDEDEALVFGDAEALDAVRYERALPGGIQVDSTVYLTAAFAVDTAYVAPIPVRFTSGDATAVLHTDSTWIPVRSLVPAEAEDIRDLAPIVTFPRSAWWIAAGIALALLAAAGVFWWMRRRRSRKNEPETESIPLVPPDQEAFDRLAALEKIDLSDPRNMPFFYDELSGILRTYAARRLHVPALEMTTSETVACLEEQEVPDGPAVSRFRNVLATCDYVKFADARPPARQGQDLIGTSRSLVETMERQARAAEEAAAAAAADAAAPDDASEGQPTTPAEPAPANPDTP